MTGDGCLIEARLTRDSLRQDSLKIHGHIMHPVLSTQAPETGEISLRDECSCLNETKQEWAMHFIENNITLLHLEKFWPVKIFPVKFLIFSLVSFSLVRWPVRFEPVHGYAFSLICMWLEVRVGLCVDGLLGDYIRFYMVGIYRTHRSNFSSFILNQPVDL